MASRIPADSHLSNLILSLETSSPAALKFISNADLLCQRGFPVGDKRLLERLLLTERIFVQGLLLGVQEPDDERLVKHLETIGRDFIGVFFEGMSMALALLDLAPPWRKDRWQRFTASQGANHVFETHVGLGMAIARLDQRLGGRLKQLDPVLRWLVVDGYGFHQGYFKSSKYIYGRARPAGRFAAGYSRQAFDQGLGRSLWFVEGGSPERIGRDILAFPAQRQADLWAGVGVAAAHAGGVPASVLNELKATAGKHAIYLAQGAAFAACVRARALTPAEHTGVACEILCGISADAAAELVETAFHDLPQEGSKQAHEVWQQRIRAYF